MSTSLVSLAEGILVQREESGVAPSAAEPLRVDEAVVEGSGVVDGADEVVVTGERGREVRVACVSRGRTVSGRGGPAVSVLARKILVRLARLSGVTAAARRRRGGSRAPMPSVVRSPANSDILRRVPRARWTLAASTRQYPFSASRVPELSFSAPFAAPRRLGLDDLAATRKVLALARRGRRVPKVENARLRDVTSGNPNPRGAVARRGVEIDASIFAFYFCVIFFRRASAVGLPSISRAADSLAAALEGCSSERLGFRRSMRSRRVVASRVVRSFVPSRGAQCFAEKGAPRLLQVSKISNWRFFARETPTSSGKRTKTNRRS